MGKKKVQAQSRNMRQPQAQQVRQVRPRNVPAPAAGGGDQRKQRERYIQSGGMLQGYAPETVVRIGYIAVAGAAACALIGAALGLLLVFVLHYAWYVGAAAGLVWIAPIMFGV